MDIPEISFSGGQFAPRRLLICVPPTGTSGTLLPGDPPPVMGRSAVIRLHDMWVIVIASSVLAAGLSLGVC